MGKLLKKGAREAARKRERERRASILEAAAHTFIHTPYADVDLDAIGRRAGVPTGMTSAYVGTREELYLVVLRRSLDPWFEEVGERLAASERTLKRTALAGLVTGSLTAELDRVRLLGLLPTVLEHNVEPVPAMDFTRWLRERVERLGASMEKRCPGLGPGEGVVLLLCLQVLFGGVLLERNVSGMFAAALQDAFPGLSGFDPVSAMTDLAVRLSDDRP